MEPFRGENRKRVILLDSKKIRCQNKKANPHDSLMSPSRLMKTMFLGYQNRWISSLQNRNVVIASLEVKDEYQRTEEVVRLKEGYVEKNSPEKGRDLRGAQRACKLLGGSR